MAPVIGRHPAVDDGHDGELKLMSQMPARMPALVGTKDMRAPERAAGVAAAMMKAQRCLA